MDEEKPTKISHRLAFTSDAIFVYSPEKELMVLSELAENKKIDWKPAIVFATAYMEKFGIDKLKKAFEDRKIKLLGCLESLSLNEVAIFLYGLRLVDEKYFTWMVQLWKERLKVVHQKGELPAYVGTDATKKYKEMITRALEVLGFLKS